MFEKILIANRGEIAIRVARTASEMGVRTVAVYSEADSEAPHVRAADEALCIGPAEPGKSYLDIDAILQAATESGAEAIHPGYGFLSENPEFARKVSEAGLVFIGPPAEVMEKLGDKLAARRLAMQHDVPVIPGMRRQAESSEELKAKAEEIGYPVLLKAAAGGGGKGMRVVHDEQSLADAFESASREAESAFGDGTIYLEKVIDRPRHVEIQVLADNEGNTIHLFERECSIQRRHQKIIEESPCAVLGDELRKEMGEAAVRLVKAAGYVNAGTVEFLLDESGRFYFLEVNTRLQVEHPVTEFVTGLDLVRHQLEIAAGNPISLKQEELLQRGHAIECRIYAEDPAKDFAPDPGRILFAHHPSGPGIRFDAAIESGMEVPVYYDPMLGKLIAFGETRQAAICRMKEALSECVVLGVRTANELLIEILSSAAFRDGKTHTAFLKEHFDGWQPSESADAAAVFGFHIAEETPDATVTAVSGAEVLPSPWRSLGGWTLEK